MSQPGLSHVPRAPHGSGALVLRALALALVLGAAAIAGGSSPPADAGPVLQTSGADAPLVLDLDVFRVAIIERDGERTEVLQLALEVAPGTLLEWWLRAWTVMDEDLPEVALDLPLPAATAYVAGSAWLAWLDDDGLLAPAKGVPHDWSFSADDGATFGAEPLVWEVGRQDGSVALEPVPPEAYTHVRVRLDAVPVGVTLVLVARTIVR